ncbi:MAG: protein translocase subunit SecD [Spirochaetia bacterium]
MSKRFRLIIIVVLLVISGIFLYPTARWYFTVPQEQKNLATSSRIQARDYSNRQAREDLDLLLAMDKDNEVPVDFQYLVPVAKENYRDEGRSVPGEWTVETLLDGFQGEQEIFDAIESEYFQEITDLKELRDRILELGLDLSGGMNVVLRADRDSLEERIGHTPDDDEMNQAIETAIETLNNRIDQFGVTEPQIRRQGTQNIIIDVPGDTDPDRVNSFLMGKGSLNFHIVDREATDQLVQLQRETPGWSPEIYGTPDFIPAGTVVRGYYTKDRFGIDKLVRYIAIKEDVQEFGLDGSHITEAEVIRGSLTNRPEVIFTLDNEGSEDFYRLTQAQEGEDLAIVLDEKVKAYATIQNPIPNGRVSITGFASEEAQNIATVLRTAAMPIDLVVESYQSIGATLGEDAIRAGVRAIILGFALVIVFMASYYKGAGFIADLALILNLFFIVAILSVFNLTLTLTSIAGIILTVGMAVDANVIIFERIKEEYRLGKSPRSAISAGFKKAFWTIMDANITTFIAAIFLSQLGSGPIKGFAVTLAVGIISSIFTALFVSRLIFEFFAEVLKRDRLSISWRIK